MLNFINGMTIMYLLGIPLMFYISEPVDEEDHDAPYRFALMWPLVALEVIYRIIRGDTDGTGTD